MPYVRTASYTQVDTHIRSNICSFTTTGTSSTKAIRSFGSRALSYVVPTAFVCIHMQSAGKTVKIASSRDVRQTICFLNIFKLIAWASGKGHALKTCRYISAAHTHCSLVATSCKLAICSAHERELQTISILHCSA